MSRGLVVERATCEAARQDAGFTLLEVMISLAILAVGLVAISSLNGGAVAMHAYGRRATQASLLLRGKMLDVEEELQKKGFSDFNDEKHGQFADEDAPEYAWSAEILKPDVQLDPSQLLNLVGGGAQGQGKAAAGGGPLADMLLRGQGAPGAVGGTSGAAAMLGGPLGGMMQTQAKTFIETLKKSVREIRLTVSWPDGKQRRSVSASQIVVILPESVGQTPNLQPQPQLPGQQPGRQLGNQP
jgi:general secretion pathway protein I